jgi:hypothetical protein
MATIYHLSERLGRSGNTAAGTPEPVVRDAGRSATIIFFTGVRYERWPDAADDRADDASVDPWAHGPASGSSQR